MSKRLLASFKLRRQQSFSSSAISGARRQLQPFLLERFDGWNDSTKSLSSSECEPMTLSQLLSYADDQGKKRWEGLSLGYVEPSQGSDDLRQEILKAQFADLSCVDAVNVCAPQEGIFLAIQALCQPGDHIICVAPAYQSLHEVAKSLGCQVELWWPEEDTMTIHNHNETVVTTMRFCPEKLQAMIRPGQTKLVVANFPHNPTGALPTRAEFDQMVNLVQEAKAWFLVDEMYRGLEHPKADGTRVEPLPSIATQMPRGISLGGMSKSYGLPGLRLGWLVNVNADFQQRVAQLKDYTTICPASPSESLAYIALRAQDQLWQRSRDIVARNLPLLRNFVLQQDSPLEWCEPKGGTFAWIQFHHDTITASEYCNDIRQRTGIMIVPSALFPECQDDRIRLTYGRKVTREILPVLKQDLLMIGKR